MEASVKKELVKKLDANIEYLNTLYMFFSGKSAYVVESEYHVNIGKGKGLNGTGFDVKCPATCCKAVIFESREEAERVGINYYLIDVNRKTIPQRVTPVDVFLFEAINNAKKEKLSLMSL